MNHCSTNSKHQHIGTTGKERSVAFKIRQNTFLAKAAPRTLLGKLATLPRPPSRLERGHPPSYPIPLGAFGASILPPSAPRFEEALPQFILL